MKKLLLLFSLSLLVCISPAIAQSKKSFSSRQLKSISRATSLTDSYSLEVGHEMLVTPLLASVKLVQVDGKEQSRPIVFNKDYALPVNAVGKKHIFRKSDHIDPILSKLKTEAMFDFCREYNADLIVMPQFKIRYKTERITETNERNLVVTVDVPVIVDGNYVVEVCVAGHPAVYSNFRDAERGSTEKEIMVVMPNGTTTSTKSSEVEGAEWIKNLYNSGVLDNQEQITRTSRISRLNRKSRKK